jgi:hypothetical protein
MIHGVSVMSLCITTDVSLLKPFAGHRDSGGPPRLPGEHVTHVALRRRLLAFATSTGQSFDGQLASCDPVVCLILKI